MMKQYKETSRDTLSGIVNATARITTPLRGSALKRTGVSKGRLRPEIAVPVIAGMFVVAAGAVVVKAALDRKEARASRAPKPSYIKVAFSPLDEIDRELGSNSDWAVADRPTHKRQRHQVLVVSADAVDLGLGRANPHGAAARPALAIRTDNQLWHVARLPEEVAPLDDYDPRIVVGVELGRENGLVACLGKLSNKDFFTAAPSNTAPTDQVMDARHFAESYEGFIVRS